MTVSQSGARPATHWDATFTETESGSYSPDPLMGPSGATLGLESLATPDSVKTWTLHIGNSFFDVATSHPFYGYIENFLHHGITSGCGNENYCPGSSIRRDQMAVFLLKARYGYNYMPPACTGMFSDVPCPGNFTDWVEEVSVEGIIDACGAGMYCPADPVTRADMAMFLLKDGYGGSYTPPPATGIFGDVPVSDPKAPWIEDLYHRQITAGCNANPLLYCPETNNNRGQMAVFLVKLWGWRLYGV